MPDEQESLAPCPFCGAEALGSAEVGSCGEQIVACSVCGGTATGFGDTREGAVAAWNRRVAAPPRTPVTVEEIARMIDPSSWRVMDSYLASAQRECARHNAGYDLDAFKHKDSMALASAILQRIAEGQSTAS
jgi:hypothetical protein